MLIEAGADVNAAGNNPQKPAIIHSAVAAQNIEIVRLLIEKGAKVNVVQAGGFTPLHEAAATGNRAMTELLLKPGRIKTRGATMEKTPAEFAAARNHPEIAEWLRGLK